MSFENCCVAALALFAAACFKGGDDGATDVAHQTETGTEPEPEPEPEPETETETGSESESESESETETETETGADDPCGNGAIDQGEECDGDNFGAQTCMSLGFDMGELACDPVDCVIDTSVCAYACPDEAACAFLKPNIAVVLDYSTSMNQPWQNQQSRWEASVEVLNGKLGPGGWLDRNAHTMLLRFGHDPAPFSEGTHIPGDTSGIIDGHAIDLPWFDQGTLQWYECPGQELVEILDLVPAPMMGETFGIGTWTQGALMAVQNAYYMAVATHPEDIARTYVNIVLTDGAWTSINGTLVMSPQADDPSPVAATLNGQLGIKTYVVVLGGEPQAESAGHELAIAGGTSQAYLAKTPLQLEQTLTAVLNQISNANDPICP